MAPVYRESGNKKRRMSRVVALRFESKRCNGAGSGNGLAALLCFLRNEIAGQTRMNRSIPRLLAFVVLAAIVLATGFGAMG